jgi:hypothetical protein
MLFNRYMIGMVCSGGNAPLLPSISSARIIVSILRDDYAAGVSKTVPPLLWILNWFLGWVACGKKTKGEATATSTAAEN